MHEIQPTSNQLQELPAAFARTNVELAFSSGFDFACARLPNQ
jgi:hypothetical protein